MKRKQKMMNLIEDDDDEDKKKNTKNKRKHKDSDDEYNINEEDDLYSSIDDDEEEDASYIIKKDLKRETGKKTTNKKKAPKKAKLNTKVNKKAQLRKSFKNSLGRIKPNNIQDNKENINDNNIKEFVKDNTNNNNKKSPNKKKIKNNVKIKNIKDNEKPIVINNLDKTYFYQNLTPSQWKEISNFISSSLSNKNLEQKEIEYFFSNYPNLKKGDHNIKKLRDILKEATNNNSNGFLGFSSNKNIEFESYQKILDYIINNYYMVKPSIFEVHFFPNSSEEIHLINLISKTKASLDIAMFTINNVRIAEEIKNIFNRGIKLRIISDGECIKMPSSNIYSLAAMGISIKTDDSVRYHMHHKFCVIDNSVVITGSFNWTDQAVNHNQENLLFLENKDLAMKYSNEFQRLWDDFEIVITKEKALSKIKEDEEKKKAAESRKKREKEKKLIEKENKKKEMELIDTDNNEEKCFSKKKRNRNELRELTNNDYKMNEQNQYNNINENENKGTNCSIF